MEDEEANHQAEEEEEVAEEEAVEVDDEAAPPDLQAQQPEPSRRNRFNLTIIGEEENNDLDEMSPSSTISPDRYHPVFRIPVDPYSNRYPNP